MAVATAVKAKGRRRAGWAGVRGPIRASTPGHAGRAKGSREVDEMISWQSRLTTTVPALLAILVESHRAHVTRYGVSAWKILMLTIHEWMKGTRLCRTQALFPLHRLWFDPSVLYSGKTTNRRAVCGRSARTVRRGGRPGSTGLPYPYLASILCRTSWLLSRTVSLASLPSTPIIEGIVVSAVLSPRVVSSRATVWEKNSGTDTGVG